MIHRPIINEAGEVIPFTVTEFDLVELCVVGYNEKFDWITKKSIVLPKAYDSRESIIQGFISDAFELPVIDAGEVLELRMIKDNRAYCIEIANKSSDVCDEWGSFTALPDEGKRFAIENLADVTLCWAGAQCNSFDEGTELTWCSFLKTWLHAISRGVEVGVPKGADLETINRTVDEFDWIASTF